MKSEKTVKSRKTIHFLSVTLVVAMLFASCNQHETMENIDTFGTIENVDNSDETLVRFTGAIAQQAILDNAGTRMADTEWSEGDAIGIFMISHDESIQIEMVENKKYTFTEEDGTFQPVPGNELYYPVDGTKVNFVAYYPFKEGMKYTSQSVSVEVEQTTENQQEFDLLYASNNEGHNNMSNSVALQFHHMFSKILINIKQPSTLSKNTTGLNDADLEGMEVSINGMRKTTYFNFSTGSFSYYLNDEDFIPRTIVDGVQYDAIVIPWNHEEVKVTFTLKSGESFTWPLPEITFESGNQYNYTVIISRQDGVEVVWEITDWTENEIEGNYYAI